MHALHGTVLGWQRRGQMHATVWFWGARNFLEVELFCRGETGLLE
jgi:hypothetical protein